LFVRRVFCARAITAQNTLGGLSKNQPVIPEDYHRDWIPGSRFQRAPE
jgi:hypothetical protein